MLHILKEFIFYLIVVLAKEKDEEKIRRHECTHPSMHATYPLPFYKYTNARLFSNTYNLQKEMMLKISDEDCNH